MSQIIKQNRSKCKNFSAVRHFHKQRVGGDFAVEAKTRLLLNFKLPGNLLKRLNQPLNFIMIDFKRYLPPITGIEIIARRFSIRDLDYLRHNFGGKNWRKLKGNAFVELHDGLIRYAELHWYECHGIGKRGLKIKRWLN